VKNTSPKGVVTAPTIVSDSGTATGGPRTVTKLGRQQPEVGDTFEEFLNAVDRLGLNEIIRKECLIVEEEPDVMERCDDIERIVQHCVPMRRYTKNTQKVHVDRDKLKQAQSDEKHRRTIGKNYIKPGHIANPSLLTRIRVKHGIEIQNRKTLKMKHAADHMLHAGQTEIGLLGGAHSKGDGVVREAYGADISTYEPLDITGLTSFPAFCKFAEFKGPYGRRNVRYALVSNGEEERLMFVCFKCGVVLKPLYRNKQTLLRHPTCTDRQRFHIERNVVVDEDAPNKADNAPPKPEAQTQDDKQPNKEKEGKPKDEKPAEKEKSPPVIIKDSPIDERVKIRMFKLAARSNWAKIGPITEVTELTPPPEIDERVIDNRGVSVVRVQCNIVRLVCDVLYSLPNLESFKAGFRTGAIVSKCFGSVNPFNAISYAIGTVSEGLNIANAVHDALKPQTMQIRCCPYIAESVLSKMSRNYSIELIDADIENRMRRCLDGLNIPAQHASTVFIGTQLLIKARLLEDNFFGCAFHSGEGILQQQIPEVVSSRLQATRNWAGRDRNRIVHWDEMGSDDQTTSSEEDISLIEDYSPLLRPNLSGREQSADSRTRFYQAHLRRLVETGSAPVEEDEELHMGPLN
jgi:hypothetical protein